MSPQTATEQALPTSPQHTHDPETLVSLIYRFASRREEYANLLLALSNCITTYYGQSDGELTDVLEETVLPHFRNAVQICHALSETTHFRQTFQGALERLPMAAGVSDRDGNILAANSAARKLLNQQKIGAAPEIGDLRLSLLAERMASERIITAPVAVSSGADSGLQVFAVSGTGEGYLNTTLLEQVYALTPAELRVGECVVRHHTTREIAQCLGLQDATVRDHLSHLYEKMGVNRKPELIRKLLFTGLMDTRGAVLSQSQPLEDTLRTLILRDGRQLGYREYGAADGRPVFLFHNIMGSSMEPPPGGAEAARALGVRLIVPERPGYGDSDPQPGRTKRDWCEDIHELARALGLERVDIIGHSIGTQYAIACAEMLEHEIGRVVLVSTMPRPEDVRRAKDVPSSIRHGSLIIRYAPFMVKPIMQMLLRGNIESFYENQLSYLRPQSQAGRLDRELMMNPAFRAYCIANFSQSAKQGVDAWAEELKLGLSDWGFTVRNQAIPYQLWHGGCDDICSLDMVREIARDLPVERFNILPRETHYLFSRHFPAILHQLVMA